MKKRFTLIIVLICFIALSACGIHVESTAAGSTDGTPRSDILENDSSASSTAPKKTLATPTAAPSPSSTPSPSPKADWVTVFIAFENYHEGELEGVQDALEAAGYKIVITSTQTGTAVGMSGDSLQVDMSVNEIKDLGLGIIIVGGTGIVDIWYDETLLALVRQADEQGLLVAGICAGPGVLGNAGVLNGKRASWYDGPNTNAVMDDAGCENSGKSVTIDGYAVTGNGPSAAVEFGDAIVSVLNLM